MQGWSLDRKIQVSQTRIIEWFQKWDNQVYVSFSDGKDSTVLADLTARVCKATNQKLVLWFSNTGLEFPEIVRHVKYFDDWLRDTYEIEVELIIDYPKSKDGKRITFKDVIIKYGYPIISKEISKTIKDAKSAIEKGNSSSYALKQLNGNYKSKDGKLSLYNHEKYKYLLDAPFKISNQCCNVMKKRTAHRYEKDSGRKPIIGTMASESRLRRVQWMIYGCNSFDMSNPSSKPMSFWTEQDVLEYLFKYDIPFSSVYGEIKQDKKGIYYTTGCNRTGCIFCGFGCHLEKEPNRFQRLKQTHPKLWEYCMKPIDQGGLGMKEVLEFINVKIE